VRAGVLQGLIFEILQVLLPLLVLLDVACGSSHCRSHAACV
jgi:hypothetical protein